MSLTLEAILELDVVRAGAPEVLSGHGALDAAVRWVHVAELRSLADLLEGGELVLTTGLAFGDSPGDAGEYLAGLQAAGAAGVIVEIPAGRPADAAALAAAAALTTLPVIRLHRTIRFVEVTEVVHRRIVARQLEQVEKAREVHEVFTMLSLQSAGVQEIVDRASQLLGAPVVLEDSSHLVVAFAAAGLPAQELLQDWQRRSRAVHGYPETRVAGDGLWLQTPVGLGSTQWGRLVLPGAPREPGAAAEAAMVLERAGQALSINRLAERDQAGLAQQAQAGLIHELRGSRTQDDGEALSRASALGLKPSPAYLPLVLHLDSGSGKDPMSMQRKERALLEMLDAVLAATRNTALAAALQTGQVAVLLALPARMLEDSLLERICGDLAARTSAVPGELVWTAGVGRARSRLADAAAGLDEAAHVAQTAGTLAAGANRYFRSTDVRLRGLLALLREDPRAVSFADAELRGLDAEDLALLQRFLECGGNKTELARSGYLSRPTLYARLAKLEARLGVSLDDPESRTSLHVAVLLHQLQSLPAGG
ncbi:PucR family transcriptional regulator ligand-binding domain-containing protein [Arthrobacter caoxuetaonis]|uniref:PucR family transcriptional regulator ligand-binding domain-containing protein n=1 Tax=Arthrobacter caoxuetaonis TaxID=2886935 RepID=A0A9X1MET1_9MICC|nr:PucR family transcriptional regulator ligand-binding domain-containing protein [Arthrobacter caoxuetaonis]MCC3282188.1 PucR family transcriptional regulator ligand-binding domain-containing protein [Arthrobacter caoxuetaonis]MCC3297424.1 PucR family transcriptional regulator ligand-binding domain-containing protein [Arthrobacter caoxuetaonis]USQ58043.1 PucR family transcriptional regulator ligand-binding domain-containing protein [Arthrobacter caoxuetaonis]